MVETAPRDADLMSTRLVEAQHITVGMRVVDWHDDHGHGVFGSRPQSRRVTEVHVDGRGMDRVVRLHVDGDTLVRHHKADRWVEVEI